MKKPVEAERKTTSKEQVLVEKEKAAAPATRTEAEVVKEPLKAESEKSGETQPLEQPRTAVVEGSGNEGFRHRTCGCKKTATA